MAFLPRRMRDLRKDFKLSKSRDRVSSALPSRQKIYRALDANRQEFRLLVVEAGLKDEPVRCSLEYASISDSRRPSYETVSYVWGNQANRGSIHLHGSLIDVPASSEAVLRRLRYHDNDRILWMDAVCINQDDLEERAYQVAMMDVIYSNTFRNLIWLGNDEDGTAQQALDTIEAILEDKNEALERSEAILEAEQRLTQEDIDSELRNRLKDGLSARVEQLSELPLQQYFASDWFTRLWVLQEASLAPESICYCGESQISLENVLRAAQWMMLKGMNAVRYLSPGMQKAQQISKFAMGAGTYHPSQGDTMLRLLQASGHFQAHDPRDHVYALVGLYKRISGNNKLSSMLMPNYKVGVAEAFRNATLFTVKESQGLAVLSIVDHLIYETTMPTWVPRWDRTPDATVDTFQMPLVYKPDGGKPMSLADMTTEDPNILPVIGFVVDFILEHTDVMKPQDLGDGLTKLITEVQEFACRVGAQAEERCKRVLGVTLVAGSREAMQQADAVESARSLGELTGMVPSDAVVPVTDPLEDHRKRLADYVLSMFKQSRNRRLFSTASGYVGLGPQTLKSGDVLTVIYGCPLPLVLRPVDIAANKCELAGACYVHDIMDGAAFRQHQASGRKDVKFLLV